MSIIGPELNLASPLNYAFILKRSPNVQFQVQQVVVPGFGVGEANIPTPFTRITNPGNFTYENLTVTCKVGEQLKSYLEIYEWMVSISNPKTFSSYNYEPTDCTVKILSNSKRPLLDIIFTDVFPTSISGLNFDSTLENFSTITVDISFSFDTMEFRIQE